MLQDPPFHKLLNMVESQGACNNLSITPGVICRGSQVACALQPLQASLRHDVSFKCAPHNIV
jgi:hypothetical protein